MKAQATARKAQGYTKRTPMRCEECARRNGEKCVLGGFQVARWGVCGRWKDKAKQTSSPAV